MNAQNDSDLNHYLKILVKSSLFIFLATVISKLASYGYKILIARSFGAEVYGLFSLALIVISIAASIATLGLGEGLVRYISLYRGKKDLESAKKLIITSRNIFFILGLIFTIILILIAPILAEKVFHSNDFTTLFIEMVFAFPFILLATAYLSTLRGFERVKTYSALVNIYQNTFRFVVLAVLILAGIGELSISISYIITFIGLFLLARHYSKKDLDKIILKDNSGSKKIIYEALNYCWPLLFVGIFYSIFYWTDSLMLGFFTDVKHVGIYSAAITIISLFSIAPDLFMQLFFPLVSFKMSEGKKEIVKGITQQVTKWIYLLNIPIFLILIIFPEKLLLLLFNDKFLEAVLPLQILSLGALFASIIGLSINLLSIIGKTRLILRNFIALTGLNIILNLILIPKYGMIGASIATLITWIVFCIVILYQVFRNYKFNIFRGYFWKLIIITSLVFVIGLWVKNNIVDSITRSILLGIGLMIIYFFALYLFNVFDKEDKEIMRSIRSKILIGKGLNNHIKELSL